ncbi:MAG: 4Fe-4S dicluster domain-containing protein [Thermodesulfobacteriota bacterium]
MYFPKIDREKCKFHGECFRICPEDVFDMTETEVVVARPGDCTGCQSCIVVCPEDAVTVEEL